MFPDGAGETVSLQNFHIRADWNHLKKYFKKSHICIVVRFDHRKHLMCENSSGLRFSVPQILSWKCSTNTKSCMSACSARFLCSSSTPWSFLEAASFPLHNTNGAGEPSYMLIPAYSSSIWDLKYWRISFLLLFIVGVSRPFSMENISVWMWMALTCRTPVALEENDALSATHLRFVTFLRDSQSCESHLEASVVPAQRTWALPLCQAAACPPRWLPWPPSKKNKIVNMMSSRSWFQVN